MRTAMVSIIVLTLGMLLTALPSYAGEQNGTAVSQIIAHKSALSLTDSQLKKLELVEKNAEQKMREVKAQADIRLNEIEKFTSNWTDMNSIAVMSLIKEYFNFMQTYKSTELDAVIKARAILSYDQLIKFQQLVSIETLMLNMESSLASR